jgi:hypothetical protein
MFDRFVSGRKPSWTRRTLLIGSLGLHVAVALALVVGSWFHVAELTPPALAIVFFAHEPPPQGSTAPAQKPQKAPRPPHAAKQLTQPTTRTTAPPPTDATSENPGDQPSDEPPGTGPIGPPSTSPPCPGGNCNGPAAPAPKPLNVPPHALDAQRLAGAMPHLPSSVLGARRGLGEATFTARLCVDQSGVVSSVTVLSGIPGADGDIVSTLRNWRYKPQAIPVCFITQLVYNVE